MPVKNISIGEEAVDQRIDNFLFKQFKLVPKTRVYKAIRKGEVRVNGKRVSSHYHLSVEDKVRLPPFFESKKNIALTPEMKLLKYLEKRILYEDDLFLILNKPPGMASHGGSGLRYGVIEALRVLRPHVKALELVHRLDRDTSGCLLIAKKRSSLRQLHALFREQKINKTYTCLCQGRWKESERKINLPLLKGQLFSGERKVSVSEMGQSAVSVFKVLKYFKLATLLSVQLETGRTHQIRVHAQSASHPLAGDDRYGNRMFNQMMKTEYDLNRLFLHSAELAFQYPGQSQLFRITAPLEEDLNKVLDALR